MSLRSRSALVVAIVGLLALAGALVGQELASREATRLLDGARGKRPDEILAAAEAAVRLRPGLERAHAVRAFARALRGELELAREDLALSGEGLEAKRARAWLLLRSGETAKARELLEAEPKLERDVAWLVWLANGFHSPPKDGAAPEPLYVWDPLAQRAMQHLNSSDPVDEILRNYPGTIQAHAVLLHKALSAAIDLDEPELEKALEEAKRAPPRERALALELERRIRAADRGELPGEPWARNATECDFWVAATTRPNSVVEDARNWARRELLRHEILGDTAALARATRRLTRSVAVAGCLYDADAMLAAALVRDRERNRATLARLRELMGAKRMPDWSTTPQQRRQTVADALYLLGDVEGARRCDPQVDKGPRLDELLSKEDAPGAAELLGLPDPGSPATQARALRVARAEVLGTPWTALEDLEALYGERAKKPLVGEEELDQATNAGLARLAVARAREHPVEALAVILRFQAVCASEFEVQRLLLGHVHELGLKGEALEARLVQAGLAPEEAQTRLAELEPWAPRAIGR